DIPGRRLVRVVRVATIWLLLLPLGICFCEEVFAEVAYKLLDPQLRAVEIDSSDHDSFLSVKVDSSGRLIVGSRASLFLYEPNSSGGYSARRELYRFPADSWIYDTEIRGNDIYAMTNRALYLLPNALAGQNKTNVQRLIWGHPAAFVHQCLHGLAWGPD